MGRAPRPCQRRAAPTRLPGLGAMALPLPPPRCQGAFSDGSAARAAAAGTALAPVPAHPQAATRGSCEGSEVRFARPSSGGRAVLLRHLRRDAEPVTSPSSPCEADQPWSAGMGKLALSVQAWVFIMGLSLLAQC